MSDPTDSAKVLPQRVYEQAVLPKATAKKVATLKVTPPKPKKVASVKMAPPKPHRRSSNAAAKCTYLLETVLGNMKDIEDHGTNDNLAELNKIYEQISELNSRIIKLR